jgi:hypothetical protein
LSASSGAPEPVAQHWSHSAIDVGYSPITQDNTTWGGLGEATVLVIEPTRRMERWTARVEAAEAIFSCAPLVEDHTAARQPAEHLRRRRPRIARTVEQRLQN